ncbi:division/cell wall cluster transcriptional repressor MraZ [Sneathia vaginalis]|uniref:division/cell wall cluster transcriptional repressor MraZ n=1 Tax=Sneathia vaginalis TaxID=187101 RepID=UPI00288BA190|nr:division/cell wall cluster transcriptional repressor MraZ [Sneathia vaginalis]
MTMIFMGEYNCKIDSKGRITFPAKLREQLEGQNFVITRGLDKCIDLFPMDKWNEKMKKLENIKTTDIKQRTYVRFLLSAATELDFDAQGRINIPQSLKTYSELEKEVVVIGQNGRMEIWSKSRWDSFMSDSLENIADIAQELDL